jgi:hypothetical protein
MFPDDEDGLDNIIKQQETRKPELDADLNDDEPES